MSIQEHLNKIRNAICGREVRESIAKGIETAYDDASEKDNANMEVKIARGTHPNLRSRLEEVDDKQQQTTAQLAQTEREKVDKDGSQQVNWANIAQDAREQISGDKVAVVGRDSVGTENLTNSAVTKEKTDFIHQTYNLFNKEDIQDGHTLNLTTGELEPLDNNSTSGFIKVKRNTDYNVQRATRLARYDSDFNFLTSSELGIDGGVINTFNSGEWIRVSIRNDRLSSAQITEGSEAKPYQPYRIYLSPEISVSYNNIYDRDESSEEKEVVSGNSQIYKKTLVEGGTPDTNTEVIDMFDEFLQYEHVKKEVLGVNDFGNEIIVYRSENDDIRSDFPIKRLKLGIMTGLHGNERNPVVGFYHFLKDLFDNPQNNENFELIKSLVDIHYIPLANPSGWNLKTRNNGNGVNLNRNFSTNFDITPDSDKGSGPASEIETQLIQAWMEENNFDYYLDIHTTVGADDPWFSSNHQTDEGLLLINDYYRTKSILNNWWREREDVNYPDHTLGYINDYTLKLAQSWIHAESYGAHGFLLELSNRYSPDSASYGPVSNTFATETIGNLLMQFFKRKGII